MRRKCDKDYFDQKLAPLITEEIVRLTQYDGLECCDIERACGRIWGEYVQLNTRTSILYMKSKDELLDRHKVASCYMYACLKARPIEISQNLSSDNRFWLANEMLSLSVACAVLYGYLDEILDSIEKHFGEYQGLNSNSMEAARSALQSGVRFESFVAGFGTYEDDVLKFLFFTAAEGNYNILALSLIIYHWEQSLFDETMQRCVAQYVRRQKEFNAVK